MKRINKSLSAVCFMLLFIESTQDILSDVDDFGPDLIYDVQDQSLDKEGEQSSAMGAVRLLHRLTDPNRYDLNERPFRGQAPVNVTARTYVYVMSSIDGSLHMQLKLNMKLQLSYLDPRLKFSNIVGAPSDVTGDSSLLERLWTPHIFLANERRSFVMGAGDGAKDITIRVTSSGHVYFITRFSTTVICTMKEGRFPFDQQDCPLLLESWIDESDNLVLNWASAPVLVNDEFSAATIEITDIQHTAELVTRKHVHEDIYNSEDPEAQYWRLRLNFSLSRLHGLFIMDYYLPSILLVVISWVSFWLHPDIVPARVLLGSSTMLTFIMLAVQTDKAPPSSYVKASEIWFLGCTTFIFGSLVEFAFVNTIWRKGAFFLDIKETFRAWIKGMLPATLQLPPSHHQMSLFWRSMLTFFRQNVRLKKVSTRHILKSTLGTPRSQREPLTARERYARRRTSSLPDLHDVADTARAAEAPTKPTSSFESQLGRFRLRPARFTPGESDPSYMHTLPSGSVFRPSTLPVLEEMEMDDNIDVDVDVDVTPSLSIHRQEPQPSWRRFLGKPSRDGHRWGSSVTFGWTHMSATEVSAWIDKRSRLFFPVAFFVFNLFYWAFVSFF